jgi:hypothetical protein
MAMTSERTLREAQIVQRVAGYLALPHGEYFFNGSSVLALHGINRDRPMGDIDIFVTTALWFDLLEKSGYTRTTRLSPSTLAQEEGRWWVIQPDRKDFKRRIDPPILRTYLFGITVDIFLNWRKRGGPGDFDPALYLLNTERINGLPCAPLQLIMDWKLGAGRSKDLLDVVAIREYLGFEETLD